LTSVTGRVAVRNDGVMALAPDRQGRVLFFSPSGTHIGTVGDEGEFSVISRIGWRADTLWTWDVDRERITLISPDLKVARVIDEVGRSRAVLRHRDGELEVSRARPLALYSDGSMMANFGVLTQPPPEPFHSGRPAFGIISSDREVINVLFSPPAPEVGEVWVDGGSVIFLPFMNRPVSEVSPAGEILVSAMDFVTGQAAGTLAVTAWDRNGREVFRNDYFIDLERIPRSVRDSMMSAQISDLAPGRPGVAAALREAKLPDYYPPIDRVGAPLVVGRDSTIWLRLRESSAGRPTVVLDPSGDVIGTVMLPSGARVVAAELDRIWVLERDSAGKDELVRYQVSWVRRL